MNKINRKSSITLAIITSLFTCAVNVDSNTPQDIPPLTSENIPQDSNSPRNIPQICKIDPNTPNRNIDNCEMPATLSNWTFQLNSFTIYHTRELETMALRGAVGGLNSEYCNAGKPAASGSIPPIRVTLKWLATRPF